MFICGQVLPQKKRQKMWVDLIPRMWGKQQVMGQKHYGVVFAFVSDLFSFWESTVLLIMAV